MKFLDQVKIYLKSGNGGGGCVSFRREKFIEFGGPDGGNGGKGGDIIFKAVSGLNTLIDYRYQQHFKAEQGHNGLGKNKTGRGGKDLILEVPVGTQILADDRKTVLADLEHDGQEICLLKGGIGGKGNAHYKSSTQQAPRRASPGTDGGELWVWLQLKLIADVGLIGLPNAGKSTFLRSVTSAKPKVADYPFTTLHPQLGVVRVGYDEFIMADIPGLIEGAHIGVGLGTRFLGHVERCHLLLHLVSGTNEDVVAAYTTVRKEIKAYAAGLEKKEEVIALNKCDLLTQEEIMDKMMQLSEYSGMKVLPVSAKTHKGTDAILKLLLEKLKKPKENGEE